MWSSFSCTFQVKLGNLNVKRFSSGRVRTFLRMTDTISWPKSRYKNWIADRFSIFTFTVSDTFPLGICTHLIFKKDSNENETVLMPWFQRATVCKVPMMCQDSEKHLIYIVLLNSYETPWNGWSYSILK
jgi:hypothetical protein